ncbi:MAG: hypothetical protein AB7S26_11175 [Sandaracinaceae bacterium]
MEERDLTGRCGTCAFYTAIWTDQATGHHTGECRLGCWPAPLKDSATCTHHKPRGTSWEGALKRKKAAGTPRRMRDDEDDAPVKRPLPREVDIDMDIDEFRRVLREVLQEELGVGDSTLGERWRGGEMILKPGREGTQEKSVPLEAFFKKIIGVRDKLRVLEQKVNSAKGLSDTEKLQLQQYITGCYGSLTTFNVLFKDKDDQFVGQSGSRD